MSLLKYLFGAQALSFKCAQLHHADEQKQALLEAILPANGSLGRDITRYAAKLGVLSLLPYNPLNTDNLEPGYINELGAIFLCHSITTGTPLWIQPPHPRGDIKCDQGYDDATAYIQTMPYEMGYKGSQQLTALDVQDPEKDDNGWRLADAAESKQIADLVKANKSLEVLLNFEDYHYMTCQITEKWHAEMPPNITLQNFNYNYEHCVGADHTAPIRLVRTEKRLA
jgi:hypothetical protein